MDVHPTKNVYIGIDPYPNAKDDQVLGQSPGTIGTLKQLVGVG